MSRAFVGNDVVDLDDPSTRGKEHHARFLERVLDPAEHEAVLGSEDPHLALWVRWAAKEAAYKVVSKLRGKPPVFVHRSFVTRGAPDTVEHEGIPVPVKVLQAGSVVHVVAALGAAPASVAARATRLSTPTQPRDRTMGELLQRFTPRETEAIHSPASAAVRLEARAALATELGVEERRLEIVCAPGPTGRRPPLVFLDGAPAAADVSLSHHGRWIGWALVSYPSAGS